MKIKSCLILGFACCFVSFLNTQIAKATSLPSCEKSDIACIIRPALQAFDPAEVKSAGTLRTILWAASTAVIFSDQKTLQDTLEKISKVSDDLPYSAKIPASNGTGLQTGEEALPIPNSSPAKEKTTAEIELLAALGKTQQAVKLLEKLKNHDETFEADLEPQALALGGLVYSGRLQEAKEFLKASRDIKFKPYNSITEFKWPYGPPQILLIEAFLNQDRVQDALETKELLKNNNVFSSDEIRKSILVIFNRYYFAKKKLEYFAEHKSACMEISRELDNPDNYQIDKLYAGDRIALDSHMNYRLQAVVGQLMASHCFTQYPDTLEKINLKNFPVDPELQQQIRSLKNSSDPAALEQVFLKEKRIYKEAPQGVADSKACEKHSSQTTTFIQCIISLREVTDMRDIKENAISKEFNEKYP